jgi:DNA fragmentation factor alpha subunit
LGSENIQIVLEEDGTEVLEDDYLMFLENNTKLMILPSNNHWNPPIPAFDETDCPAGGTENSYNPVKILQKLVRSPGSIALLSEEELDVVSSFTSHQNIGILQTEVEYLISACQRELEQKKKIKDALDLVDLYQRAKQQSDIHP